MHPMEGHSSNGTEYCENGQREDFDLIIIGAGPTGLLSALLARQLDLTVCIFDSKEGPLEFGGADAITARTQQYLEIVGNFEKDDRRGAGILGELLKRGIKCNKLSIDPASATYADGEFTSRQSQWWNSLSHTFYDNFLMIGQPYIELLFASHLDIPIHYSEPVITFSHSTSPLSVTVETPKRTVTSKYCLAADGARSFMRNKLGIGWEGTKPNMVWTVMDCWIETTFPIGKEIVTLQVNGESRMAWIPRERGMQRFYTLLDGDITQEKAEASIREHMAPHTVEITHVEWLSRFEIKERVATSFLHPSPHGPFILAGDAAHVHAVNGGQGMNTGLSDAFNLIWRLYFSIKCPGIPQATRDALLGSYDLERRATAKEVVEVASKLVRATMTEAKQYVKLIEKNSGFITGMGVTYAGMDSPLVQESKEGIFEAGFRCPDLWLQEPETRDTSRLYERLLYGRYVLLVAGDTTPYEINPKNAAFLTVIRLKPLKAAEVGTRKAKPAFSDNLGDPGSFGCSWIKDGARFTVLVRPDAYIAYVGPLEETLSYLDSFLPGLLR